MGILVHSCTKFAHLNLYVCLLLGLVRLGDQLDKTDISNR